MSPQKYDDNSSTQSSSGSRSGSGSGSGSYESYESYDTADQLENEERERQMARNRMREEIKARRAKRSVIDTPMFHSMVGAIVVANAAVIGFETDYGACRGACTVAQRGTWYFADLGFTICFLMEMLTRMYICGRSKKENGEYDLIPLYFNDPWNRFDFLVVFCAILDTGILSWIEGMGGVLKIMTVLRIVRIFRLVRVVRLVPAFRELYLIISGMMDALKTIFWVFIVMCLILYCGAIYITMSVGHDQAQNIVWDDPSSVAKDVYKYGIESKWSRYDYWGTVGKSMFSLFQLVTMDNWVRTLAWPVLEQNVLMILFFVFLLFVVSFGLLNIILGVIVENTMAAAGRNAEKIIRMLDRSLKRVAQSLKEIFEATDADGSGTLEREELAVALKKSHVQDKLRLINVSPSEMTEMFELLDYDSSGSVTIEEFNKGLLLIKGTAKSKEMMNLTMHIKAYNRHLDGLIEDANEQNQILEEIFNRLHDTEKEFRSNDTVDEVDKIANPNEKRRGSVIIVPQHIRDAAQEDNRMAGMSEVEAPPLPPHILAQQELERQLNIKRRRSSSSDSDSSSGLSDGSEPAKGHKKKKELPSRWGAIRKTALSGALSKAKAKAEPHPHSSKEGGGEGLNKFKSAVRRASKHHHTAPAALLSESLPVNKNEGTTTPHGSKTLVSKRRRSQISAPAPESETLPGQLP